MSAAPNAYHETSSVRMISKQASYTFFVASLMAASPVWIDGASAADVAKSAMNPAFADLPAIAEGPFKPEYESLKTYRCPQWYQDAKFGIWAHWGPQSVPEEGDWYARNMYVPGHASYTYHLAHYGHPSEFGFKDILPLWKAENFDPERLILSYKAAGAKYFVSMACHHDNFDLWNSKYHRWNAVNIGPKKDIVGLWKKAAVEQGLHFGVSEHMAVSYKWFSVSHFSDATGPKAGVPYDGSDFRNFDFYGPTPEKVWEPGGELWSEEHMPDSWKKEWYLRVRDLVDTYQPDYLYSDYGNVPFRRDVGWKLLADFYNGSIAAHAGHLEAVYTGKGDNERVYTRDFENSRANDISPEPWQMDKCVGDFFYRRDMKIMPVTDVLALLIDVVSKNGNLLLDIPLKPDGALNADEEKLLDDMAGWMKINGEALFGSRPFKIYGENGSEASTQERSTKQKFGVSDVRFTVKGDSLYVLTLGPIPEPEIRIAALRESSPYVEGKIQDVTLLGYDGQIEWSQTADALVIKTPSLEASALTGVFKISGLHGLGWDGSVYPGVDGSVTLGVTAAVPHGANYDVTPEHEVVHTDNWSAPEGHISWVVKTPKPGRYNVSVRAAAASGDSQVSLGTDGRSIIGKLPATNGWKDYQSTLIGSINVDEGGTHEISFGPSDPNSWRMVNLVSVTLTPVE